MPTFVLSTSIKAPIDTCFNLARSIDLHLDSMKHTGEKAIAGVTSGLISLHETVTWQARHFGLLMQLTSRITVCVSPFIFADVMASGPFKLMQHRHHFEQKDGYTLMVDQFVYKSPYGILGKIADALFLKKYMQSLILRRNSIIKLKAEATIH